MLVQHASQGNIANGMHVYYYLCLLLLPLFLPLVPLSLKWWGERQVALADTRMGQSETRCLFECLPLS